MVYQDTGVVVSFNKDTLAFAQVGNSDQRPEDRLEKRLALRRIPLPNTKGNILRDSVHTGVYGKDEGISTS